MRPVTRELAETVGTLTDPGYHEIGFDLFALEDRVAIYEPRSIVFTGHGIFSQFFIEEQTDLIGRESERVFRIKEKTVQAEDHGRCLLREINGITR